MPTFGVCTWRKIILWLPNSTLKEYEIIMLIYNRKTCKLVLIYNIYTTYI